MPAPAQATPGATIVEDRIATSIHNKQFRSDLSERAMWFGAVRHLITHAWREDECPAVFQLRMEHAFNA